MSLMIIIIMSVCQCIVVDGIGAVCQLTVGSQTVWVGRGQLSYKRGRGYSSRN